MKTFKPRTLNAEKEYRRLKKLLTHKTHNIETDLKVSFMQPTEQTGWIHLILTTERTSIIIHCSYAFEPFDAFVWWMEGIRWDRLQTGWKIEEEGRYKKLFVYVLDETYLRFVVVDDDHYALENCIYKEEHIVLDTVIEKQMLIKQFYYGFKNFVQKDFSQKRWSDENLHETLKRLDKTFDCNWDRWKWINPYA